LATAENKTRLYELVLDNGCSVSPYVWRVRLNGATLEEFTADRISRLPALRDSLAPLRSHLSRFPFLGGGAPNYADYIALGAFLWVASVSTLPLLAHADTLRTWIEKGFDLHGGLGRDPRMNALFE
jgi:glutathione S-transferase